jgi:hypothetical protein
MRRRDFLLLATVALWPVGANGEQETRRTIGFLSGTSPGAIGHGVAGFHQGLKEGGYVEADNLTIEYRWASGRYDLLPTLVRPIWSVATWLPSRRSWICNDPAERKAGGAACDGPASLPLPKNPLQHHVPVSFGSSGRSSHHVGYSSWSSVSASNHRPSAVT